MASSNSVTAGKPRIAGAVMVALLKNSPVIPSAAPTSVTEAVPEGFTSLGYVSEDGVTNSNAPSSEQVKAWGGDVVMTTLTEKPDEFNFTLLEATNAEVLKVVYGDANVTGSLETGITVKANASQPEPMAWVIDVIMTGNTLKRIVIPNGTISSVGEITYKDDSAVAYEITVAALPDGNGNTHYEYIKQ